MRIIVVVTGLLVLSGCGLLEDRTNRYMSATKGEPLVVPEWYSSQRLKDRYPIPEANLGFVASKDFVVPSPPEPGLEILLEQFVIKATDSDTWLLASEAPGKIWPALKTYWEGQGAQVFEIDTGAGQMQVLLPTTSLKASQYIESHQLQAFSSSAGVLLQIQVQQGLKRRSSEIRIAQAGDNNSAVKLDNDTQLILLGGVKSYLDDNAESLESYSLVAQNIGGEEKLSLVNELDQEPYIRVKLDFDRAWFAVGEALEKGQVAIIDLNRSEGTYFVQYSQEQQKEASGFWSWFKGKDEDLLSDRFNFRVELSRQVDGIHIVTVPTKDNVDPQDQVRLLNQLLDHLS